MSTSYEFGQNWRKFLDHDFDDAALAEATNSLRDFLGVSDLRGKTFLDIGCGSGIFSLAANRLGASRIVSLDVDPDSVACCSELWSRAGAPSHWRVLEGSILDRKFVDTLGEFDVVYSWGVLHHTGAMWSAIENSASRVRPGGLFYVAIYNRADGIGLYSDGRALPSRFWEVEKRFFNRLPSWGKRVMEFGVAATLIGAYVAAGRNPIRIIRSHKSMRGMAWIVDIRDWLGGYPYEYASAGEVFQFVHDRVGFSLEGLKSTNSLRCNEFLFRRPL